MPHSQTYNSIILKAYDVGEADRFLILFTREKGRMTARARAVRKLKSKL
ncbi:recombination protein O N-terminal domain-containing protein, partial [Patescibacteria group bacterium]|nr:recombination protein O N-terminal domain-containing protein [Patescibacteria group bacterium]